MNSIVLTVSLGRLRGSVAKQIFSSGSKVYRTNQFPESSHVLLQVMIEIESDPLQSSGFEDSRLKLKIESSSLQSANLQSRASDGAVAQLVER